MTNPTLPADYTRAFDTLDFLMGAVEAETLQRLRPTDLSTELPVILVTGFLGAGKTTLMRRLVSANHGLKLTAVVNDMANLNVDAALIADAGYDDDQETVSLANGCVCCSQSGGIARTLADIQMRGQANGLLPDYVVVEASGVADPAALAGVVGAMAGIRLDAVVAVVDADGAAPSTHQHLASVSGDSLRDSTQLIKRGVQVADLILINKTDLVLPPCAEALEATLAAIAPKAAILRTAHCAVPPALIFDEFEPNDRTLAEPTLADDRFITAELRQLATASRAEIETLVATAPSGTFRMKGVIQLADADRAELLQAVGRRWSWTDPGAETQQLSGRLVIIAAVTSHGVIEHFRSVFG